MSERASDAQLIDALAAALSSHFQRPCRVEWLDRRPSPYSTSFAIEELDLVLEDGRALRLIFKDLGWDALVDAARDVRPRFLHDPRREIAVYRDVLAPAGLGTAEYFGSHVDEERGRHWLFLEHVPGAKFTHVGDFGAWGCAARWLARMHTRFARFADPAPAASLHLIRYDRDYYWHWLERARPRLAGEGWVLDHYDGIIERLGSLPRTMIHGQFYAGNVLLRETGRGGRVCPIDWETAAAGPALMDLAALVSGKWDEAQRMALISEYRQGLVEADAPAPAPAVEELAAGVDLCRVHQAVQWLGWADRWTPPAEEAVDWAVELRRAAARVGGAW
jgi:hypothetical protein